MPARRQPVVLARLAAFGRNVSGRRLFDQGNQHLQGLDLADS